MMISQPNRRTMLFLVITGIAGLRPSSGADDRLTSKGELRVGLVITNAAVLSRDPEGKYRGVAMDVGNALAAKLGVASRVVPYENQTRFNLSIGKDEWDVAIGPRDLSRTGQLAFSNVFMEAD